MNEIGKILIIFGLILTLTGLLLLFFGKIPLIGKLPGDIIVERRNFVFYFPLATSILISVIISLIIYLLSKR